MIRFQCDRCERAIEVDDAKAGTKVDCPFCGDMNKVPSGGGAVDRASAAGLPPDSGPEAAVMMVRPAFWRGSPFLTLGLALFPLVLTGVLWWLTEMKTGTNLKVLAVSAGLCWVPLAVWWLIVTRGMALEITNKRTIQRKGLFSRATSEVLHDHVRNIQVEQSFVDRVLRVGSVGISSSGQDGIEVLVRNMPSPKKIRSVIDKYRPM
ncbi:MAG: PH domain-containing protein [Phycisphaerales bacterium]|nr:PH domain-containing protein [Phycisphaerales bacterium]